MSNQKEAVFMWPVHFKSDRRVEILRRLRPLSGLSERDLVTLAATLDEVRVPDGAVLTREGRVGEDCFLVVEGNAEVTVAGEIVGHVGPGEFVGEMAVLNGAPRSATVRAVTSMHLFTVHKSGLAGLLDHGPIACTLLSHLTDRLRVAEGAPEESDTSGGHEQRGSATRRRG